MHSVQLINYFHYASAQLIKYFHYALRAIN